MCIWTSNKRLKFHVKIPSDCLENGKQLEGILFASHCMSLRWSDTVSCYRECTIQYINARSHRRRVRRLATSTGCRWPITQGSEWFFSSHVPPVAAQLRQQLHWLVASSQQITYKLAVISLTRHDPLALQLTHLTSSTTVYQQTQRASDNTIQYNTIRVLSVFSL